MLLRDFLLRAHIEGSTDASLVGVEVDVRPAQLVQVFREPRAAWHEQSLTPASTIASTRATQPT
jgi:hypothetical protein